MKTKYAVFDTKTSEYVYTTPEDLSQLIAKMALESYLAQTHGQLYSEVKLNIDGSETWKTPDGDEATRMIMTSAISDEIIKLMDITVI
jgi:hypothetical protein